MGVRIGKEMRGKEVAASIWRSSRVNGRVWDLCAATSKIEHNIYMLALGG